jgi:hypothetical protein
MPAMNTTQFGWVKNRMRNDPQPVPPIFKPELAAEVVAAAGLAKHPGREYWVGTPAVMAIVGQKFIPGLLDEISGKQAISHSRFLMDPGTRSHPTTSANMFPACTTRAAKFAARSSRRSAEIFLSVHPGSLALATAAAITVLGGVASLGVIA